MIYLIGGAPRTGKTTLAKRLAKELGIPWISTDALEVMAREYIPEEDFEKYYPYTTLRQEKGSRDNDHFYSKHSPKKIVQVLKDQAEITYPAIDAIIANEIDNGNDYILEGYHLLPSFIAKLIKKHGEGNIKPIFLTRFNPGQFAVDVHKSTTPNDWLLVLTKKEETFVKVGEMVAQYSRIFEEEANKNGFFVLNLDTDFEAQIEEAIKYTQQ